MKKNDIKTISRDAQMETKKKQIMSSFQKYIKGKKTGDIIRRNRLVDLILAAISEA
jgi:hypothetical protein